MAIKSGTNRYKLTQARINEYGLDALLQAIDNIKQSSFLKGQNDRGWTITYDWLIKPNNFLKVYEGNYNDKGANNGASNGKDGKKVKYDKSKFLAKDPGEIDETGIF